MINSGVKRAAGISLDLNLGLLISFCLLWFSLLYNYKGPLSNWQALFKVLYGFGLFKYHSLKEIKSLA